jgi:hypothetical protein
MRETPSGSGTFTDFTSVILPLAGQGDGPTVLPAGDYFAAFEGNFFGALAPAPLSGTDLVAVLIGSLGLKSRSGRIGRVRVLMGADGSGTPLGTREPTILQFVTINTKTGVFTPIGESASVPWGGFVDTSSFPASADVTKLLNVPLRFLGAKWERGDILTLKVTLGAITQGDPVGAMQLSIESAYEVLAPVIGPSER